MEHPENSQHLPVFTIAVDASRQLAHQEPRLQAQDRMMEKESRVKVAPKEVQPLLSHCHDPNLNRRVVRSSSEEGNLSNTDFSLDDEEIVAA